MYNIAQHWKGTMVMGSAMILFPFIQIFTFASINLLPLAWYWALTFAVADTALMMAGIIMFGYGFARRPRDYAYREKPAQ